MPAPFMHTTGSFVVQTKEPAAGTPPPERKLEPGDLHLATDPANSDQVLMTIDGKTRVVSRHALSRAARGLNLCVDPD